jgi:hypothetical protein
MKKQFHITWFVDDKKDKLSGTTIEAENIIIALNRVCDSKIPIKNGKYVDTSVIKYAIEI